VGDELATVGATECAAGSGAIGSIADIAGDGKPRIELGELWGLKLAG
jgi:hypothetical protein